MCQVSLGLKNVQMGPMTLNITRCLFLVEIQGISILRRLLPRNLLLCQQAVITAMLTGHTTMYVPSFIRIERGSDGGP